MKSNFIFSSFSKSKNFRNFIKEKIIEITWKNQYSFYFWRNK